MRQDTLNPSTSMNDLPLLKSSEVIRDSQVHII